MKRSAVRRDDIDLYVVRNVKNHACRLSVQMDAVDAHVANGVLVNFRRALLRLFTIDPKDPRSFTILKSTKEIALEMERHITRHLPIMHPFSKCVYWWHTLMIFVFFLHFVLIPVEIIIPIYFERGIMLVTNIVLYSISILDIVRRFFTGYCEDNNIVLNWRQVARHYLTTYFIIDVCSTFPFDVLYFSFIIDSSAFELFCMLKVFRFSTWSTYLGEFLVRYKYSENIRLPFVYLTAFLMLMLNGTALVCIIIDLKNDPLFYYNNRTLTFAFPIVDFVFSLTYVMNPAVVPSKYSLLMVFTIVWLYIGFFFTLFLLSKMVEVYCLHNDANNKHLDFNSQIDKYMKYKGLSPALNNKVNRFVQFKYQQHIFNEKNVMANISPTLYKEVMNHNCKSFVKKVDFFKDLPENVVYNLVSTLRLEIYLTNDTIFQAGNVGNSMYFIYQGKVALYTLKQAEICHLHEGSFFGEIAILSNAPRSATVVAITECELYRLHRKDFEDAIAPYPDIIRRMRSVAADRIKTTQKMMTSLTEEKRFRSKANSFYT